MFKGIDPAAGIDAASSITKEESEVEKQEYIAVVVEKVHRRTLAGKQKWTDRNKYVTAELVPSIEVSFAYKDRGPDSAVWEYYAIKSPVGTDMSLIANPNGSKAGMYEPAGSDVVLEQMHEIFNHVVLAPRRNEFAAKMKQLTDL